MTKPTSDRDNLGKLIIAISRLWRRAADGALDDCGLSHATAMPLVTLSRLGDNIRHGQLADQLGVEGPSLVRIVDLLLADGLVTRVEDPADRRAKILSLTASGRKRVDEIERILGVLRTDILNDVDDGELHVTVAVLEKIEGKLLGREA